MSTLRQKIQAATNRLKPGPATPEAASDQPRRSPAGKRKRPVAPVTAHRLFPALAAVWFAALLGLGSLAVPGTLLGAVVLRSGLPALVPAAAPPLGFTAHLLVAFALAGFGAALGLALALRLRPRAPAEARPVLPVAPVVEAPAGEVYKVRARDAHPDAPARRPLVLTEAFAEPLGEPAFDAEPAAPLLRRKRDVMASEPVSDAGPWIPEYTPGTAAAIRPLDLSSLDLDDAIEPPAATVPQPDHEEAAPTPEPAPEPAPAESLAAPALIAATPQLPAGLAAKLAEVSDGKWSPVAGAPLENLGLVQLIERLALAIAEQKAANEAVIKADEAAEAEARLADDLPAIGSAREAILRRLGASAAGEPSGTADAADGALKSFARPAPAPVPTPVQGVVPLRPMEPLTPVLSLATAASAPPPETDEALRSALATLQRMTARA